MSTIIRFKRRLTEGSEGIKLLPGEPFFNVKDKKFYVGDENGTPYDIVEIKNNNSGENSTISFTVGNHQYNKTINNVAHSTEAEKLTSTNIGNSETPVYFVDGKPTACDLPEASDTKYGLVKLGYVKPDSETRNYCPVAKDENGKLYVYVAGPVDGVATGAQKLTKSDGSAIKAGSSTQPVYFVDGVPTPCGYTIAASVPSTAKFTDTTYTYATNLEPGLIKLGKESDDKSTLQDHLPLLKSTEGEGYIDVTKINKSITWETF